MKVDHTGTVCKVSDGMIRSGLYEGNNATFETDRSAKRKVFEGADEYTYFGTYRDVNFTVVFGKFEYKGDHTAVITSCFDTESGTYLSPTPSLFIEQIGTKTDEQILAEFKKRMCSWITDGKYEASVRNAVYIDHNEFLKNWTDAQKEEWRRERNVVNNMRGENFFLHNDCPCRIVYCGQEYSSVTEAFEEQKGRGDFLRSRQSILNSIVFTKFAMNKDLQDRLLNTEGEIEYECDDEWLGTKDSIGANKVGKALMLARKILGDERADMEAEKGHSAGAGLQVELSETEAMSEPLKSVSPASVTPIQTAPVTEEEGKATQTVGKAEIGNAFKDNTMQTIGKAEIGNAFRELRGSGFVSRKKSTKW